MWYTYIIKSINKKWFYVGSTNRLEKRLEEHNLGKNISTKAFRPFKYIFIKNFFIEKEARQYERKLKDCRKEKEKIISDYLNKNI